MTFPIMLYAQVVRGLSPTRSALLLVPMAVISGGLAPVVGRLIDRVHPRYIAGVGLFCFPVSLVWLSMRAHARGGDLAAPAAGGAARRGQRLHVGAASAPPPPATCR